MFDFLELNEETRQYMLVKFEVEEASENPYRSDLLSKLGLEVYPDLMRQAISDGNEQTIYEALLKPVYWKPRHKGQYSYKNAARRLADTEFNTWYVRGLAHRLMDEGETHCKVYRAAPSKTEGSCPLQSGTIYPLTDVYNGHRIKYWGDNLNQHAISIPAVPNCHHSICRITD